MGANTKTPVDYDVRVALYATRNGDAICIRFRESLEELLCTNGGDRIKVMRVGNRLYFVGKKNSQYKHGDGTAVVSNSKLQYSRKEQVEICRAFVGEYSLEFDAERKCYYVDLNARRTFGRIGKSGANIPHNYGKRAVVKRPVTPVVLGKTITKVAEEKSGDAFFNNLDNRAEKKDEIIRLLDILDVDETQAYARSIVRLVKELINATY